MNNLYEALEVCLQEIEQGADLETVLFRYPDLATELRPILEAARNARDMSIPAPSLEVVRRNRAKILQRAAEMREGKARSSSRRFWFASLRRVAVTLIVVIALFVSGTGLVRAASTTIPGDNLYPVKRTWEDVLVIFTFNLQQRDALEVEHENERLSELKELFAEKRSAEVEFAGTVTNQNGSEWLISGISVVVSAQTEIHDPGIVVGSAVRVKGWSQANGGVLAEKIELLPPGAKLPEVNEQPEMEPNEYEDSQQQQIEDNSGKGAGEDSSNVQEVTSPSLESQSKTELENSGSGSGSDSHSTGDGSHSDGSSDKHGGSDSSGGEDSSGSGGGSDG